MYFQDYWTKLLIRVLWVQVTHLNSVVMPDRNAADSSDDDDEGGDDNWVYS